MQNEAYYEESRYMVMCYLQCENIQITEEHLLDDMTHQYYKNYYYYEMDEDYALKAAVSVVLKDNNITMEGFELWIP